MPDYDIIPAPCFTGCGQNEKHMELPLFKAVLVFDKDRCDGVPAMARLLQALCGIEDYIRLACAFDAASGRVHVALACAGKLLLCNSYEAPDCVTALYYMVAVPARFGFKPSIVNVHMAGDVPGELGSYLSRYFKGVKSISCES